MSTVETCCTNPLDSLFSSQAAFSSFLAGFLTSPPTWTTDALQVHIKWSWIHTKSVAGYTGEPWQCFLPLQCLGMGHRKLKNLQWWPAKEVGGKRTTFKKNPKTIKVKAKALRVNQKPNGEVLISRTDGAHRLFMRVNTKGRISLLYLVGPTVPKWYISMFSGSRQSGF